MTMMTLRRARALSDAMLKAASGLGLSPTLDVTIYDVADNSAPVAEGIAVMGTVEARLSQTRTKAEKALREKVELGLALISGAYAIRTLVGAQNQKSRVSVLLADKAQEAARKALLAPLVKTVSAMQTNAAAAKLSALVASEARSYSDPEVTLSILDDDAVENWLKPMIRQADQRQSVLGEELLKANMNAEIDVPEDAIASAKQAFLL